MHKNTTTFLCKIPLNRIIKKSSQCTKKGQEKKFFCAKVTNFKNFSVKWKKPIDKSV